MSRNTVAAIWIGGLLLAAALYVTGPDSFLQASLDWLTAVQGAIEDSLALLSVQAFEALRAAAIAVFAVFLVLGLLAALRGLRARMALILVSAMFLLLTQTGYQGSVPRWLAALVLAGVGAGVMTRRLLQLPGNPWGVRR